MPLSAPGRGAAALSVKLSVVSLPFIRLLHGILKAEGKGDRVNGEVRGLPAEMLPVRQGLSHISRPAPEQLPVILKAEAAELLRKAPGDQDFHHLPHPGELLKRAHVRDEVDKVLFLDDDVSVFLAERPQRLMELHVVSPSLMCGMLNMII